MVQHTSDGAEAYTPEVILITGGAGFIASHLAIRLITRYPHYKVCRNRFGLRFPRLLCSDASDRPPMRSSIL